MDRTCGTCLRCQQPTVLCNCDDQTKPAGQPACDDYAERTDSVEQVARDMYRRMTCMAHYECHNNDCECCIDADCKVKEVFGDRLEALGVEL